MKQICEEKSLSGAESKDTLASLSWVPCQSEEEDSEGLSWSPIGKQARRLISWGGSLSQVFSV